MRILIRIVLSLALLSGAVVASTGTAAAATCSGWLLKGEYRLFNGVNGNTYGTGQVEEYFRGCYDGTTAWRNPAFPADPHQFYTWWTSTKPTLWSESVTNNNTALVKAWTQFELGNHTGVCPLQGYFKFRIELSKTGTAVGFLNDSEPCWPTAVDYWLR